MKPRERAEKLWEDLYGRYINRAKMVDTITQAIEDAVEEYRTTANALKAADIKLAVAEEREASAKVVWEYARGIRTYTGKVGSFQKEDEIAEAIRSRK